MPSARIQAFTRKISSLSIVSMWTIEAGLCMKSPWPLTWDIYLPQHFSKSCILVTYVWIILVHPPFLLTRNLLNMNFRPFAPFPTLHSLQIREHNVFYFATLLFPVCINFSSSVIVSLFLQPTFYLFQLVVTNKVWQEVLWALQQCST